MALVLLCPKGSERMEVEKAVTDKQLKNVLSRIILVSTICAAKFLNHHLGMNMN